MDTEKPIDNEEEQRNLNEDFFMFMKKQTGGNIQKYVEGLEAYVDLIRKRRRAEAAKRTVHQRKNRPNKQENEQIDRQDEEITREKTADDLHRSDLMMRSDSCEPVDACGRKRRKRRKRKCPCKRRRRSKRRKRRRSCRPKRRRKKSCCCSRPRKRRRRC